MNTMNWHLIEKRQQLAEEYARFSQSYNGLGKVLGGVVGLVVLAAGTFWGAGTGLAVLTIVLTLLWLVGKETIRARLYRPFGTAHEAWQPARKRWHLLMTGFIILISLGIGISALSSGRWNEPGFGLYLLFVLIMPFVVWRWLRTDMEFIVGVSLLAACAVHGAGGAYNVLTMPYTWPWLIGAPMLIIHGLAEHRRFRQIEQELQETREEQGD